MKENTKLKHVALQYTDKSEAEVFFGKILGLEKVKTFDLSKELSDKIFEIKNEVSVDVYSNESSYFEIFYTKDVKKPSYEHVCIEVDNKEEFVNRCKKFNIDPIFVKKGEKELLFVKDFSGNLFEVTDSK